jgi:predicted XRE-type DNA-binding protein
LPLSERAAKSLEPFNNLAIALTFWPVDELASFRQPGSSRGQLQGGAVVAKRRRTRVSNESRQAQVIPKEPLAREIRRLVTEKGLSQADAAVVVQDAASQLSLLLSGKLRGFSIDRLVRTLLRLGREVEIVVRPSAQPRRARQATVRIITSAPARRRRGSSSR